MSRSIVPLLCALVLSGGCATTVPSGEQSLHDAVVQRLAQDAQPGLSQLTVRENGGTVSINGFVSSLEQQQALDEAIGDIGRMDGVRSVDNRVSMTAGGN